MYKVVLANNNAMAWLRMAFPLLKHQHEIDASFTTEYPQGVAHKAIRNLKARVIQAKEMATSVLKAKLDAIKMKETDDQQSVDDKFNELARLYMASDSSLMVTLKKTSHENHALSLLVLYQYNKSDNTEPGNYKCIQQADV